MKKAPSFFLTAVGASRVVGGPPGPNVPLLLIFHGHAGAGAAFRINEMIRNEFPSVEQLLIASVVDLRHIPRHMRSAVELTLAAAYRQAAKHVPEHLDPTEYVLIAPDWDGSVTSAFGMDERIEDIGVAVVTYPWTTFDSYTGPDSMAAVIRIVAAAARAASAPAVNSTAPS